MCEKHVTQEKIVPRSFYRRYNPDLSRHRAGRTCNSPKQPMVGYWDKPFPVGVRLKYYHSHQVKKLNAFKYFQYLISLFISGFFLPRPKVLGIIIGAVTKPVDEINLRNKKDDIIGLYQHFKSKYRPITATAMLLLSTGCVFQGNDFL